MGYEILTLRDGNWKIEASAAQKAEAEAISIQMLRSADVRGVKVIKDSARSLDALKDGDVVFEKLKGAGAADRVFVNEIDEAPDCQSPEDLMGAEGRMTVNRLFRSYLDKNNITAMEVMHSYKELKRAMDADTLVPSAIAKVAQLQTKDGNSSTNERRDALFAFVQQISERARKAEAKQLPRIREHGFDAAFTSLCDIAEGDEFDYLLNFTLTRELIDNRNWWGKLVQTVDWAEPAEDPRALNALDGFMADTLANNSVLQDILGQQEDLGGALMTMLDLSAGGLELGDPATLSAESTERTKAQLNALLGDGKLPDSQKTIMDRVRRQLQRGGSLAKGGQDQERDRFRDILDRVVSKDDVLGGPSMAEAMTERQSRLLNKGGVAGLREAATRVVPSLREPARKAAYLLSLHDSKMGRDSLADSITEQLDELFVRPDSVHRIVKGDLPPNRKMEQVTSVFYRIQNSGLEESHKDKIMNRLDELLASYIVDGEILQKIDNPDRPLHIRAFILVGMCQPEMLPKGKASDLARKIIINSLKQPNFEEELVSQIDDAEEKSRVLRRFHEQLHRCGFFG